MTSTTEWFRIERTPSLGLSASDVPRAFRAHGDAASRRLVVEFAYAWAMEEPVIDLGKRVVRSGIEVAFHVGRYSRRLFEMRCTLTSAAVGIPADDIELLRLFADAVRGALAELAEQTERRGPRLNYSFATDGLGLRELDDATPVWMHEALAQLRDGSGRPSRP